LNAIKGGVPVDLGYIHCLHPLGREPQASSVQSQCFTNFRWKGHLCPVMFDLFPSAIIGLPHPITIEVPLDLRSRDIRLRGRLLQSNTNKPVCVHQGHYPSKTGQFLRTVAQPLKQIVRLDYLRPTRTPLA
jgi:hypothetical protein